MDACAAGDAERRPDFRGVATIDDHGIVRGGSALTLALGIVLVGGRAAVHQYAAAVQRQLETQGIGMRMTRQIVGADGRDVRQQHRRPGRESCVAGIGQQARAFSRHRGQL